MYWCCISLIDSVHLQNLIVFLPAYKVEITGAVYIEPEIPELEVVSESNINLIRFYMLKELQGT